MHTKTTGAPKLIAFFLPQFHPTPENDEWWGKGFTEWTNVTKAKPLFEGHYQPHLPTDFGFYDLRLKETRHDQIKLAKQYGIDGFCYHYYWFSGKRILYRPIDDMYADQESDMPYCFCWANENWTRRWDAAEHEILISQKYRPEDDLNFIKDMVKYFRDPRYIKVDGAPFLIVYRPQHLPDSKKTIRIWREYCESVGIGKIHLCAALTHENDDYASYGFDSGIQFPPHQPNLGTINEKVGFFETHKGHVIDYRDLAKAYLDRRYSSDNVFLTTAPSWDNTARTGNRAFVLINSSPNNYQHWLASAIKKTQADFPDQERMGFINAWNEWAEGCHLEPDRMYGHQFLEATLNAKLHPDPPPEMKEYYKLPASRPQAFHRNKKLTVAARAQDWMYRGRALIKAFVIKRPVLYALFRKLRSCLSR
jgi:lipopolysaccharide biosynthesis protein